MRGADPCARCRADDAALTLRVRPVIGVSSSARLGPRATGQVHGVGA
jgi:hypothetical protein